MYYSSMVPVTTVGKVDIHNVWHFTVYIQVQHIHCGNTQHVYGLTCDVVNIINLAQQQLQALYWSLTPLFIIILLAHLTSSSLIHYNLVYSASLP